jgi:hypothetical protein
MNLNDIWNNDDSSTSSLAHSQSPVYFAEEATSENEYESRVSDALTTHTVTRQVSLSSDSEGAGDEQNDLVKVCM